MFNYFSLIIKIYYQIVEHQNNDDDIGYSYIILLRHNIIIYKDFLDSVYVIFLNIHILIIAII